ncbi:MAG: prolipoprotein diacylglyceryl transferase [Oscillospiraceae bacterium]|nr:prolipoprotein diacylglyceryl transferase [Oscillospiraceae bacterium]
MNLKTIITLLIGTGAMLVLIAILMKRYEVKIWKSIPVSFILTVTGTIGTYIWFFVEASWFGGRSYYGAVFIVPLVFVFIAKLMKIPYGELMDFCAPAECIMLAIMKYQCLIDGCCGGKVIKIAEDGSEILFPSQIIELVNAAIVMAVLMSMAFSNKWRGKIYPWYLIIYGVTRFVLNLFRGENTPLLLGLPAGNLWSLLSIAIGFMWLKDYRIKIIKKESTGPVEEIRDFIKDGSD